MPLIKNPNELDDTVKPAGLIYGQPGVGKTTLLLSGPNPVLIDADNGLRRVEKRFQVPSLPLTKYADFLALLDGSELDPFDTIVVDTLGRFLERMSDYLMDINPKLRQGDGSLTLKGYGSMRIEFQRVLRKVKDKNKYLFFGAHEKEEKEGDGRYLRPDSPGSAGKDLVKDLDFLGYMEMNANRRTISFNPTDKYYAKNSLGLSSVIEVPDPSVVGNIFMQKYIIDQYALVRKKNDEQNALYEAQVAGGKQLIDQARTPDECLQALATINGTEPFWDSQRQLKKHLNDRATSLGFVYDKAEKKFKEKPKVEPKPEPEVAAAQAKATPPGAPVPPTPPASGLDVLAQSLINGINDATSLKQLNAYLKAQAPDLAEITSKAALGTQLTVTDAITAKRQFLTDDVHKAA